MWILNFSIIFAFIIILSSGILFVVFCLCAFFFVYLKFVAYARLSSAIQKEGKENCQPKYSYEIVSN